MLIVQNMSTNPILAYFACVPGFFRRFVVAFSALKVLFVFLFVGNGPFLAALPSTQDALKVIDGRKIGWLAIGFWRHRRNGNALGVPIKSIEQSVASVLILRQTGGRLTRQPTARRCRWCWWARWWDRHPIWTYGISNHSLTSHSCATSKNKR